MKRVLVLGICGSGKSTLARALHQITKLPLIHLDQAYWLPNWKEPSKAAWAEKVTTLCEGPSWIMDGNFGGTLDIRLPAADTIIYLNHSTSSALYRVLKRVWKYRGKQRDDMAAGCNERFDLGFMQYIAVFKIKQGRRILSKLKQEKDKRVFILENDKEIMSFLQELKSEYH